MLGSNIAQEMATVSCKISTAIEHRVNSKIDIMSKDHHAKLQAMVNEAVEAELPQIIKSRTTALKNELKNASEDLERERRHSMEQEVRDIASRFFWKDLQRTPKEVEALEKDVAQMDSRVSYWIKDNLALRQQLLSQKSDIAAMKSENAALREEVAELERRL